MLYIGGAAGWDLLLLTHEFAHALASPARAHDGAHPSERPDHDEPVDATAAGSAPGAPVHRHGDGPAHTHSIWLSDLLQGELPTEEDPDVGPPGFDRHLISGGGALATPHASRRAAGRMALSGLSLFCPPESPPPRFFELSPQT